jgi:hypothetical protein
MKPRDKNVEKLHQRGGKGPHRFKKNAKQIRKQIKEKIKKIIHKESDDLI